jgi:hypothetical protein
MYREMKKLNKGDYMVSCTAKNLICRITVCVLAVLALIGCFNQLADDAVTITINLSRSANRAAYPADDETWSRLVFVIEFSGSSSVPSVRTEPGTQTVNVSVPPGSYVIMATAFMDGEVYARGSASAQARVGYMTSVPLILYYTGTNDTVIDIAAIEGVTVPVTGGTPVTVITDNDQYSGDVTWEPDHSVFAPATRYTATISLTAKDGYTLQGVAANFFTVANARKTSNLANSGVITVEFSTTAGTASNPAIIDLSAIPGVTVPVTGGTPVTKIPENPQYSGTITWSPAVSGTFAPNTDYTATITLTTKTGFTLQGVEANSFTVAGAVSTGNSANSGVVTAVFPKTYTKTTVNITAIAGVTVPVTGGTPDFNIIETTQYTGTVSWSPSALPTFASATIYTATITLFPETDFTLDGVTVNLFTVAEALSVKNNANSGTITAVFPKTDTTISIDTIAGVTAPKAGETPVSSITETAQYTGTVSWKNAVGVEPAGAFADNNIYIATITLEPKPGYTLNGIAANLFTVAGALSRNSANSGVITATFQPISYALGSIGPGGGRVFYFSAAGFTVEGYGNPVDPGYYATYTAHYLEVAPNDRGRLAWSSTNIDVVGTSTDFGTGRKNTNLIAAKHPGDSAANNAAKACKELAAGGNGDWFLPSKDELEEMYNSFLASNISNGEYWSSSQSAAGTAWYRYFQEVNNVWRSYAKGNTFYVRAIRAF